MEKSREWLLYEFDSIIRNMNFGVNDSYFFIDYMYSYLCRKNLIKQNNDNLMCVSSNLDVGSSQDINKNLDDFFDKLNIEEFRELVYYLFSERYYGSRMHTEMSNKYICELASDLLEIDDFGHSIIDFGSGTGDFLINVYKKAHEKGISIKNLIGIEISVMRAQTSQKALDILNDGSFNSKIVVGNALEKLSSTYTRAYVFPPLGLTRALNDDFKKSLLFPDIYLSNKNSIEWIFIDNMLSGLINGRAVALISGKSLFNNADIAYRNKLISSGFLEGIIELPAGSLSYTSAKMYMLVFSNYNKYVKFVDASNVMNAANRRYINLELPVKVIEDMYYSKEVKVKAVDELIDVYNLCPSTIMLDLKKFDNGVKLKELADVFTGNQYTLGIFEKKGLISEKRTGYRILTSSDIEDNMVHWESLRFVDMKDNKFDKFAVKYGDVIVTSKSSKVKTVVVDMEPNEKILVTGGMIIVRPHLDKLNPMYLKMFFDSRLGKASLKSIQKGAFIVSITAGGVASIEIPLIDIKKQEKKAEKYNEKLSTIAAYKHEIERIENSLKNIFDDEED